MRTPNFHLLEPTSFRIRLEVHLRDTSNKLLRTKTWEIHRRAGDEPKLHLIQMTAQPAEPHPRTEEVAPDFHRLTITVSNFRDELSFWSGEANNSETTLQQLAAYPMSLAVQVTESGLHLGIYVAEVKQ